MDNNKYLNSFTILSYYPNNISVSFKSETLLLDEKEWIINENENENENDSSINNENENGHENNEEPLNEEYWIIDEDGKNKIIVKNLNNLNNKIIKAGPFFSMDLVVFYLNYFNEIGL